MKLRPSEMLVSFLLRINDDFGEGQVYYQNKPVAEIEQLEYDKFVVRFVGAYNDEEIRCDGLFISEFLDIVKDFIIK